jgi:chaperone required for assembly of F1-ATPase
LKRFYKTVSTASASDGWRILLDGKPIRTPAKSFLVVPTSALAQALAGEWDAQIGTVNPHAMPLNRTANTILDRIAGNRDAVVSEIANYGETDVICYFAEAPDDLVARQQTQWEPLLVWVRETLHVELKTSVGIMHQPQHTNAIQKLHMAVAACPDWQLAALHTIVSISGSLVIGLALLAGRLTVEQAWAAGQVDELFQVEFWGEDRFAAKNRADRLADLTSAAAFLRLLHFI